MEGIRKAFERILNRGISADRDLRTEWTLISKYPPAASSLLSSLPIAIDNQQLANIAIDLISLPRVVAEQNIWDEQFEGKIRAFIKNMERID